MKRQSGFTLIELIVTVALLAVLLAAVAPLGKGWADRASAQSAKSSLKATIQQARAAAIRNTDDKTSDLAAAGVCINKNAETISAYRLDVSSNPCAAGNTLIKTHRYNKGVTIKQGATEVTCMVFTPHGILTASGSCITSLDAFTLVKGAEDDEIDAI